MLFSLLFPQTILADRFSFEFSMAHHAIVISIVSVICQLLMRKKINDLTGGINLIWLKDFLNDLFFDAILMILPVLLLTIFGSVNWQVNIFSFSIIFSGFSILLLASLTEELFFRGFMFQRFIQAFGKWPAQLIVASLFLLTHINNPGMPGIVKKMASINIFVASIMFGIAYLKTASLVMLLC